MPFADYFETFEPLRLPYDGKLYEIPPVSADDGARLTLSLEPDSPVALEDDEFERIILGEARARMRADGCAPAFIQKAILTAFADWQRGRSVAEEVWNGAPGADPKASPEPPADSTPSTDTGGARKTRSRASGTDTTSRTN